MEDKQQRNLRNFQHQARLLLTEREREHLYEMLREYQTFCNSRQFVSNLHGILNTPAKLDLLRDVRNLVPPACLHEFDGLAPYDRMAHPMPQHMFGSEGASVFKRSPSWHGQGRHQDTQSEDLDFNHYVGSGPRVLTIANKSEDLGFTIKGGSEQGAPVSVSRVERGSEAERNGLVVGDEIVEVNNISFEEIAISSAIRVLQGSTRLRMTVQHNPALAASQHTHRRQSKEKMKWFDTYSRSRGPPAGLNTSPPQANTDRKVVIQLDEKHRFIGFNIRGGSEYGLGIFVSKIDRGGMAEYHRVQVGDQILSVNGTNCENIRHAEAVDLIRGQKRLVLTIRSMGNTLNQSQSRSQRSPSATSSLIGAPSALQQQSPPLPNGPVPPIPKQNKDWLTRAQPQGGVQRLDGREGKTKRSGMDAPSVHPTRPVVQGHMGMLPGEVTVAEPSSSRPSSAQSHLSSRLSQPAVAPATQQVAYAQPHPASYSRPQSQAQSPPRPQTYPEQDGRQGGGGGRGKGGGKDRKRALGRSLSMKHSGERRLPVIDAQSKQKPTKVKRNKTFRELFGLKPKVKVREAEEHRAKMAEVEREKGREVGQQDLKREEEIVAEVFQEDLARVDPIGQEAGAHEEGGAVVEKEKDGKRNRKGKSKMTGIIASFRKTRPEGIVKKRHASSNSPEEEPESPPQDDRPGSATSWASRKDSLGESHSNSSHGSLGRQKGMFMAGAGTQIMHMNAAQASQMSILEEAVKKVLSEDESTAVLRHVKRYHAEGDVDSLVTPLLAILDKPEKVVLLREVRGVIAPLDLAVYDSMVSRRELEARNILNAKSGSVSPRLMRESRQQVSDHTDSRQEETASTSSGGKERLKRHQNELERLRKQREEEVRQAKLNSFGRSLDTDSLSYEVVSHPANQSRHGSFDTYSNGERRDMTQPPAMTTFKPAVSSAGGSPANSTPEGSLSKRSAKKVLINASPQIIRTNSMRSGEQFSHDRPESSRHRQEEEGFNHSGRGMGGAPYAPVTHFGDQNGSSPKIQNTDYPGRHRDAQYSQGPSTSTLEYESPYATINFNPGADEVADTTDANESDHDSVDSDYSLSKKSAVYHLMGRDGEDVHVGGDSPLSPTKPRKLSPIPASPPSPRVIEPTPPASPTEASASVNLDNLIRVTPNKISVPPLRDGSSSNRSSGSSSDEPVYAMVDKGQRKTANLLDVRESIDSASESESSVKKVSFSDYRGSPQAPRKGILKNSFNGNERPTIPVRNPQLYIDDDDDDEPSPLKEIIRRNRGKSPVKPAARRRIDGFPGREIFQFELSKSQSSLGLSLTGGKDYKNQPYVKVDKIYPGGAVAEDGTLTTGCVLVGVDGENLLDVSHQQAMDIIRSAYTNSPRKTMQVEFMDAL
ncbi:uncharacterized protein [Diadema antillarum]|uniref:uncharacterized protein n=1 Tax=Diadema antillarum TaxID=105358 RepID=UPI003A8997BA